MKKITIALSALIITTTGAVTINLNDVQAKNSSQLQSIGESFGQLSTKNTTDIAQVNIESVQARNKMQISSLKITGSNMPNIDMSTIKPNQINVSELMTQAQKQFANDPSNTDVTLFLSFTSIESEIVNQYVLQATKYGIPIVLRGFVKNSYKETANYIRRLQLSYPELVILIDPPAYEKYQITEVPALVVTKANATPLKDGCAFAGDYTKVSGQVSIQAMLDYIRRNSKNPILATAATERLNNVRQKSYFKIN